MSLPLSFDAVLATLRRLSPSWPSTDATTDVGKELGSIATAVAMAKDAVDAFVDEFFPDTTTVLAPRWEKSLKVATITTDSIETRRARLVARLRKVNGPRISQLENMLSASLALDPSDMVWVEPLRQFIDEALTDTTGIISKAVTGSPISVHLGKPWPGVVDDTGVRVYLALSSIDGTVASLTSPSGTMWDIPVSATSGWYFTRSAFTGEPAAGRWKLTISDSFGSTLTEFRLLVSNNVDAGQIYNFFVLRDPTLPGTPDLKEAQRLFRSTVLAHNDSTVVETLTFTIGDPHSLMGRDPMGV